MIRKPKVLVVVTGALSASFLAYPSIGAPFIPEVVDPNAQAWITAGIVVVSLAGAAYLILRRRDSSRAKERRIQRQLMAIEKLAERIARAEQALSFKREWLTYSLRTELKDAVYAIATDTIRALGSLRRNQDLADSVFRKLMARSDEVFKTLENSIGSSLTLNQEDEAPFLMPVRQQALPKPTPQPRPRDALNNVSPEACRAATLPMPERPLPKAANADDSSSLVLPTMGMASIMMGAGLLCSADAPEIDSYESIYDGGVE